MATKKKTLIGTVTSNKMDKSAVVIVTRRIKHTVFNKYFSRSKKYMIHDEKNECNIGDRVSIIEAAPTSRKKRWALLAIIEKESGSVAA